MSRRLSVLVVLLTMTLVGCSAPTQQYVNADSYGMYLSLPKAWVQVPDAQLDTAVSGWNDDPGQVYTQTVLWQKIWGPNGVTPKMVFDAKPTTQPTAYAFVRDLLNVEQQQVTGDVATSLQDVIIPASSLAAMGIDVSTEQWNKNGFVGIHQVASYPMAGGRSTVEAVSMLAPNRKRLYVLVLRCSDSCYANNQQDFKSVMDSLTFKETSA